MSIANWCRTTMLKPRYSLVDVTVIAGVVALIVVLASRFRTHRVLDSVLPRLVEAVSASPLPDVRAADEKTVPDGIAYRQAYDFTVNWFTWNIPVWEKVLAPFKGQPDIQYLEIGVYEGRSAIWMLENILTHPTARLTGIDIFDGPYEARFRANVKRSGFEDQVRAVKASSQRAVGNLPLESFDIVYIDGSHAKDDVLEDAILCWRVLKPNGILIFDDYRWACCFESGTCDKPGDSPRPAIDAFAQCFANRSEVVHNSYQLILKKKPDRDTSASSVAPVEARKKR
ncbi:MAG TPA: class I SAM-dependent methyltransferase [Candidatus Anammoximicrobium sp.]|nr:class I SAM-dependent methyltransferase [Candidatus Anammoximicrobium sp.]